MLNQFFKYNNWANSLLLEALMANSSSLPESCISLFSHIVNAQTIWACRVSGTIPAVSVWQVNTLGLCKVLLEQSVNDLSKIDFPETTDSRVIKYTTSTGDDYQTSVSDILLHLFNHGTYHRGQIAKEMKLYNIKPVNTDYIQFVRLQS